MGLRSRRRPSRLWAAHFFLPYTDLSRARAHEHGARPRTPGNFRGGNRAETAHQTAQRRADVSYFGALLAGVPGAGDNARRGVFRFGDLGIADRILRIPDARSRDRDALHPGHAAVPHERALAAALIAVDPRGNVAGVAGARVPGRRGISGAHLGTRAGD